MRAATGKPRSSEIIAATRTWIERAVIGLNLCPFASAVYFQEQIRYVVSRARNTATLRAELKRELRTLAKVSPAKTETTLLIHPRVLTDFLEYNDFLAEADAVIEELDLVGMIQIASFHPQYQFAGTKPGDLANYTNRSPFPMLHLLREASVTRAVASVPDAAAIHKRNIATMRRLRLAGSAALGLAPRDRGRPMENR
jgi:uncharacterized protein